MPMAIMPWGGVSTTVPRRPGDSVSDSLKLILPGMSMSKRCTCSQNVAGN